MENLLINFFTHFGGYVYHNRDKVVYMKMENGSASVVSLFIENHLV